MSDTKPSCALRGPADWGRQATVCKAAFSTRVNKKVLVSDSKVAFGEFSADKAVVKNVQSTTVAGLYRRGYTCAHLRIHRQ